MTDTNRLIRRYLWRGKHIGRASLAAELDALVARHSWLRSPFRVLEIGHQPASHQDAYPRSWQLVRSNYQLMQGIDCVFDAEDCFPLGDAVVGGTMIFHVLYAIDDFMHCLRESFRVSERFVIFNAPLISRLAPHPDDFNRFTRSRLEKIVAELGSSSAIRAHEIIAIGGSFSSALLVANPYVRGWILRASTGLLAHFLDRFDHVIDRQCPHQYLTLLEKEPAH